MGVEPVTNPWLDVGEPMKTAPRDLMLAPKRLDLMVPSQGPDPKAK